MSFAQFSENTFDGNQANMERQTSSNSTEVSSTLESEGSSLDEGGWTPGNPGAPKAPIDDYIPWLLFAGMSIIIYSQRKNKKVNI